MAENRIDIIITTIKKGLGDKETKKNLKDLGAGFKELTGISLGWAGAIGAGAGALKKFADTAKEGVDAVVSISNTTDKFRRITGESADSLSRFIQVADDARIDIDSLQSAMQLAANKGIDVSTASIMRMSDEYLRLAPGIERNTYVSKIFGKQSGEITKILEMGSSAIKSRMEATDESITVDDAAVDASIKYQVAIDNLNDAVLALKMSLGKGLIPELTRFATDLSKFPTWFTKQDDPKNPIGAIGVAGGMSKEKIAQLRDELGRMQRATAAAEVGSDRFDKMSGSIGNTKEKTAQLNEEMLKSAIAVTDWQTSFMDAKDASAQFDLGLKMVRTGLQDFGEAGEKTFQAILLGIGDISPAAVKAYIDMQTVVGNIKKMMEAGFSTDVIVNYVINVKNGGGTGIPIVGGAAGEFYGGSTAPKPSGSVGITYTDANGVHWQQNLNPDGSEKGWSHYAAGGPVFAGQVAMVGEKGPERVVFGQDGYVFPNGSGGGNVNHFYINGAQSPQAVANEIMRRLDLQMGRR